MFLIDFLQDIWIFIKYGKRYNHLVSYHFVTKDKLSGFGRGTYSFRKKDLNKETGLELEEKIKEECDFKGVVILNIIRLYGKPKDN